MVNFVRSLFFIITIFLNFVGIKFSDAPSGCQASQNSSVSSNTSAYFELNISDNPYFEPIQFSATREANDPNALCSITTIFGNCTSTANCTSSSFFLFENICLLEGTNEAGLSIKYYELGRVFREEKLVYISKTSWGCFLSDLGIEHANLKAGLWGLQHGEISQDEYDEYNKEKNSSFVENVIGNNQQIDNCSCLIQWKEDQGVVKPLRDVKLAFIGENRTIFSETNEQGIVSYSRLGLQSLGFPAKARIFAKTKYGGVNPVKNESGVYSYSGLLTYYIDLSLNTFLSCQSITIKSKDESSGRFSFLGRAFGVCQAIYYGGKYYEEMEGNSLNYVNVWYPRNVEGAIHFDDKGIEMSEYVYKYWDVILHEYGHAIQKVKNISNNPGGRHGLFCHYSENESWNGDKDKALRLLWGESWPTVFGNAVTKKYTDELIGLQYLSDDEYSSNGNGDGVFSLNLETASQLSPYGEGNESTTIAVLYDLFDDDQDEEFDLIALGHQGFWNLIMDSEAKTFSEFASYCYQSSVVNNDYFGMITGHYGMSVDQVVVQNPDNYNTLNSPTFLWVACNRKNFMFNQTDDFRSNRYDIEFLDENGRVICSAEGLNQEIYTPSESNWFSIQTLSNQKLRIRITAYQNNYNYETGGYISNVLEIDLPNSDINHSSTYSPSTRLLEDSDVYPFSKLSYYMRSERAGRRVFQTFGQNDTEMSIYKKIVRTIVKPNGMPLIREEWVLLGEDDNSGYGDNSLLVIDCEQNTDYLVVVRNYNPYGCYRSRLIVNQINDATCISDYSDFNNYSLSNIYLYFYLDQYCSTSFTVSPLYSTTYNISVTSGFDSYLYILDPTSGNSMVYQTEYDDDSNGNLDAALNVLLFENKDYYVILTQYNPSEDISDSNTLCIRFD